VQLVDYCARKLLGGPYTDKDFAPFRVDGPNAPFLEVGGAVDGLDPRKRVRVFDR